MKIIRKIIYAFFGLETYLKLVSRIYIALVMKGFVKKKYPELFYLEEIVKPGYNCIDIGANLGYYSTFLSKLCTPNGKVYAIEPVPLFRKILERNLKRNKCDNVEVFPFALGQKEETIKMGMPEVNGVIHHGMTKVIDEKSGNFVTYFEAEMKIPDNLFSKIESINFIKCDVEGYEHFVFSNMISTLNKHKPFIQTELSGKENRENVFNLLTENGFQCHVLINNQLEPVQLSEIHTHIADFYFIPKND
jgi:FkbM family methyltransferase